jgi:hypothetical protein
MARSPMFRLLTVLVALSFGLGWGAPVAHASCGPMGSTSPDRCGTSGPEQHCQGDLGPSEACVTHHASQEALSEETPSIVPQGESGSIAESEFVVSPLQKISSLLSPVRHAVPRAHRLHVSVGLWLE